MDLFKQTTINNNSSDPHIPLANRMKPTCLKDFVNQKHILAEGKPLFRAIKADRLSSLIFYGPPGVGKTALAYIINHETKAYFHRLNAAISSVKELKEVIMVARKRKRNDGQRTTVFIDEIHRFNKAQQDVLLPDIEEGNIVLIGATTYNPFFSIIPPLLSRSEIYELKPLKENDIELIIERAIENKERGLGNLKVNLDSEAKRIIMKVSDGDARRALNILEVAALTTPADKKGVINITRRVAEECIGKKIVLYDKKGDSHYDTISAFIKSMRGSDPDAVVYWLAKMIYAGEDIRFIARRIVICAAEDVGNADPQALILAQAAMQAAMNIGLPEARIILSQAAIYVACAAKSNASYLAIDKAIEDVSNNKLLQIPNHLKGTGYKGAKSLKRGEGYVYPHSEPQAGVDQEYLPCKNRYYFPKNSGFEKIFVKILEEKERIIKHLSKNDQGVNYEVRKENKELKDKL
ncbi:MAG: replication-associated recombination protein A [Candidatus Kappaea frigidicola]|nr:replication-associated recombination protein A [Candidatus Kappaea frigidicola]